MEFTKVFHIGKKDNFRFNLHLVLRKHIITSAVLFAAMFLIVALFSYFSPATHGDLGGALLKGLLFALVGLLLWNIYILVVKIYLRLNSMYKKGVLHDFKQEIRLDSKGITATTQAGTNTSPYKLVLHSDETKSAFYIFMNQTFAYTLPKSQMTPEDIETVRSILQKYLPKSKKHTMSKA